MIRTITTQQLADEINDKIQRSQYYCNLEVFYQNMQVDLATAINDQNIRLDFHWSEQHRPAIVTYATEEWIQLIDQIEAFRTLKELNIELMHKTTIDEQEKSIKKLDQSLVAASRILELQEKLVLQGFEVICHHYYTREDALKERKRGILYYTIQRVKVENA